MTMSPALKATPQPGAPSHKAGWRRTTLPAYAHDSAVMTAGEGPANALQQRLADAYPIEDDKWSPRRTLGFIVLTCGGFWLAVGLGVRALVH